MTARPSAFQCGVAKTRKQSGHKIKAGRFVAVFGRTGCVVGRDIRLANAWLIEFRVSCNTTVVESVSRGKIFVWAQA